MVAGHLREKSGYYYAVLNYAAMPEERQSGFRPGFCCEGEKNAPRRS